MCHYLPFSPGNAIDRWATVMHIRLPPIWSRTTAVEDHFEFAQEHKKLRNAESPFFFGCHYHWSMLCPLFPPAYHTSYTYTVRYL